MLYLYQNWGEEIVANRGEKIIVFCLKKFLAGKNLDIGSRNNGWLFILAGGEKDRGRLLVTTQEMKGVSKK